ncbi:unnamed protein product [Arctogadus glacialis]
MPRNGAREAESGQRDGGTTGVSGVTGRSNLSDGSGRALPVFLGLVAKAFQERDLQCDTAWHYLLPTQPLLFWFLFPPHARGWPFREERQASRQPSEREKGLFSSVYLLPPPRSQKSLLLIVCIDCLPSLGCL